MNYYLGDACQNTFVLFDCLGVAALDECLLRYVHQCLIEEDRDDALILFNGRLKNGAFYAQMAVLGLDGNSAEFCGNGARVCAAFLFDQFPYCRSHFLTTSKGCFPLIAYGNDLYSVMLPPASFALNQAFIADVEAYKNLGGVCFVDMLEPHLIIQEALMDEELLLIGRKLNQRVDVFPHGINVNAWHLLENGHLFVKTYERGVQRLTRSCGTGSVSCAAFCKSRGNMFVSTPGGELAITMHKEGIELKGPAFFFCKNKIRKEG